MALCLGAGASVSSLPASSVRPVAATALVGRCAPGYLPERDAVTAAGGGTLCRPAGAESYADLAAGRAQMMARAAAPFSRPATGALSAAAAQKKSVPGPGKFAGSGATWSPAGASPDCDGHTILTNICPLTDNNSVVTPAGGEYTISLLGHKQLSGRVTGFDYDPANHSRIFAAPAGGGVFETTDAGGTWHSIGDALPTQMMGAVAYDAPLGRIFAGTGDNSFGGDAINGLGVFYSDNDGATWYAGAGIPDLTESFKIVPDPSDSTGMKVYAALSRGLFRSLDGGAHWTNVNLPTSPKGATTGYTVPDPTQGNAQVKCDGNITAPLCFFANIVTDVVVKKSGSANGPAGSVMAVVGWRAGTKINKLPDNTTNNTSCKMDGVATGCMQGPQNGLYVSNTAGSVGDPGSFKFQSHAGGPTDFAADRIVGRTTLGIADGAGQNNDAVYALVQDANKFNKCIADPFVQKVDACNANLQALGAATVLDGAYATYDFGKSWTKIMDWSQLHAASGALTGVPGYSPGIQSWYNNWIKPDPTVKDGSGNPTRVLFGLEEIWENNQGPVPGPSTVLTTPWLAQGPNNGPTAPWVNIGRYWNDCGGLNATAGVPCDLSGTPGTPGGTTTHPDQHAFLFVPDVTGGGVTFYAGNDGGAYKQHVDAGQNFSQQNWGDGINVGLYTVQPYDAEISRDGTIVAGLQDNGTTKIAPNGSEQHTIFGGDGFFTMIDPNNSQNIIEEYTYGSVNITFNGGKDWYTGVGGGNCGGSEAQFSTPLEQDPTTPGHIMIGCTQIQEGTDVFKNDPCAAPPAGTPGENPSNCQLVNSITSTVFDLGTVSHPGPGVNRNVDCNVGTCVFNVPSALSVRKEHSYVGYCGYCDIVTGGQPFNSGVATNVGGDPATNSGWHFAGANCSNCQTANGKLPKRLISSIQQDPSDPNTVYVTMGGYGRHWIPPGSLGDTVANVGVGHVFVSHDHAEHFSDISGNLPDAPANWTLIHNGQLVVATDTGVFISADANGGQFAVLGSSLPNAPVFTIRLQPGNPDRMIAATYGRGVYQYCFATACQTSVSNPGVVNNPNPITGGGGGTPTTSAGAPLSPLVPTVVVIAGAAGLLWRRRLRAPIS